MTAATPQWQVRQKRAVRLSSYVDDDMRRGVRLVELQANISIRSVKHICAILIQHDKGTLAKQRRQLAMMRERTGEHRPIIKLKMHSTKIIRRKTRCDQNTPEHRRKKAEENFAFSR